MTLEEARKARAREHLKDFRDEKAALLNLKAWDVMKNPDAVIQRVGAALDKLDAAVTTLAEG